MPRWLRHPWTAFLDKQGLLDKYSLLANSKTPKFNQPSFQSSFQQFPVSNSLKAIMGVFTYETETTSAIPSAKLFKAFVLDADNLIPKVAPHAIKSAEIIEGNGGPGTIKKITFGEGSQFKYVKHRIDEVDHANFTYCYSVIEGDALSEVLEKISYEIKIVASPDGGSILKSTSKYHTKG
ncbi:hypothetical protein CMV_017796 [Castanea mollissima]|uniref:Bet v I/Major latex protein domain-containing protein n=1 Tax=Castanea mollissima TaxID=60419 RepID=A0A8J4R5L6_9ROSI|nr:hypothetical protein CMV_017796 [Castanea mollissima]